ncbi:hypothetical protein DSM112329_00403 [Paraconexibacter sp. AEG42_29]|uniref:VOC domain-containing protein n=1 Tax=Paraconexibacter sp. AEG42_29 TaxID=2997339 RepID=A0AAU7APH6_9ACTN
MSVPEQLAPSGLHEAVLYADDLPAASAFYRDVVGLRIVLGPTPMLTALRVDAGSVVLLFDPERALEAGRDVPSHGTRGPGHIAFTVDDAALTAVLGRCAAHDVPVEREIRWERGGRSVYVRDPAGNSVEFVVGEIWAP